MVVLDFLVGFSYDVEGGEKESRREEGKGGVWV